MFNTFFTFLRIPESHFWIYSIIFVILEAFIAYGISGFFIRKIIFKIVVKTKSKWDDIFFESNIFSRAALIIPLIIIHYQSDLFAKFAPLISKLTLSMIAVVFFLIFESFLTSLNNIYETYSHSKERPLKGYIQIVKIFGFVINLIIIISLLLEKSPSIILSGLGALTAVLMLVFKDTLLSFTASLQITFGKIIRINDWIEAPTFNADGEVLEISLYQIKIRNWDKTITSIPTHKILDSSFKNWRGMSETGVRRVKKSFRINTDSISFIDEHMMDRFRNNNFLKEYIAKKQKDIKNQIFNDADNQDIKNNRRITNLGTFRAYIFQYLQKHPVVSSDNTLIVRYLEPTECGVPFEVYFFLSETRWNVYEEIQANIFDHILAIIPEFELSIFQNPTDKMFLKFREDSLK